MEIRNLNKIGAVEQAKSVVRATDVDLAKGIARYDSTTQVVVGIGPSRKVVKVSGEVLKPFLSQYKKLV